MSTDLVIANYLRVARDDLDGANLLATAGNRNAAYLYQQAAEKIMRAVLTSEGVHAGPRHLLDEMVKLIPDANPIKPRLKSLEDLSAYATTYRYPTDVGRIKATPSAAEMAVYASDIAKALNEAATRFGVQLTKPGTPAMAPGPIR